MNCHKAKSTVVQQSADDEKSVLQYSSACFTAATSTSVAAPGPKTAVMTVEKQLHGPAAN